MPLITQSTIERIKDLPVLDVISHYVPDLKKAGGNWCGKSPFTDEKTPSFYVVPSKNIFKCFSSGKGGSAIHFVMEKEGFTFPQAIIDIASKCSERVEYEQTTTADQQAEHDHKELLYKINQATANKYAEQLTRLLSERAADLTSRHAAVDEIINRQFTFDTIQQWQLGYAPGKTGEYTPKEWRFLVDLIGDKNYPAALELGLIKTKNGHTYDVYRNRLMYPIHNHHGRIVAFGGRALTVSTPDKPFKESKYINSSESKVYKKESVLYGLHFADKSIHKAGFVNLMEGYTDVISFHQAGFTNTVGTCGTALTDNQCALLRRYTGRVVLLYDGDDAGLAATERAIDLMMPYGFETAVVPMPELPGDETTPAQLIKDPDELVRYFKRVA